MNQMPYPYRAGEQPRFFVDLKNYDGKPKKVCYLVVPEKLVFQPVNCKLGILLASN
ncbi:hypothetical protein SAMN05720354_1191 [Nitrosospira sp. Nsp1]|nr:hypothetical protein SAMN05720354_1191 [Nitrosospira sp. Nsp1]